MQTRLFVPARAALATLVAATGLLGCAHSDARLTPPGGEPAAVSEETTAQQEAGGEVEEQEAAEEPEREWLVDENGKRYWVEEMDLGREGSGWRWIGENRIRIKYGLEYDILGREGNVFALKVYERKRRGEAPPASAEQLEQERRELEQRRQELAAAYRAEVDTVDRLRLEPFDRGLPRRGQWRNGFDVADMNGDGHPDIVFGPSRKSFPQRPNIFLGDGQGGWRQWRRARFPQAPYDYGDAEAEDFNGDGHMDLALAFHLNGLLVLIGDGKGHFEPWSDGIGLETPGAGGDASTFSSRAIEAADWNGDGRPDLLALGEGPKGAARITAEGELQTVSGPIFFLNNGDGSWTPRGQESDVFGDSLALGDFDGDGRLDFATASNAVGARSILNLGRGAEGWETRAVAAVRPGAFARAVAAGRLDGDEIDDLVIGYVGRELDVWRTSVDVVYGGENLERRRPLFSVEDRSGIYGLATGDLDGDGRLDIAFATGKGEVMVYAGNDAGFFDRLAPPELPEPVMGCRGYGVRLSDLNGDGRDELIVGFAGEGGDAAVVGPAAGAYGCAGEGSLRAWSARLVDGAPAPPAASR